MSNMLEKAARAAHDEFVAMEAYDDGRVDWDDIVRAVLMAVREPDDVVLEASRENEGCGCPCCIGAHHWTSMIDAILNESQP